MGYLEGYQMRKLRRRVSREPLSLFPDTPRWCSGCQTNKAPEEFARFFRIKDGRRSRCRECEAKNKKLSYPQAAGKYAERHLKRTYGLDQAALDAMVEAQGNLCAICKNEMSDRIPRRRGSNRHVDHCHDTGRVRALLCQRCNITIGFVKDDTKLLLAMVDYITLYRDCPADRLTDRGQAALAVAREKMMA
jgi:hypothetical protein